MAEQNGQHREHYKRWIVTLGGAGMLRPAGTWGSFFTCLILWPILQFTPAHFGVQPGIEVAGIFIFSALAVWIGPWAIAFYGREDPGPFVLDEAAGICLTLLFLPMAHGKMLALTIALAFVAFRIFDITKPPPARQLENLPTGWGILLDDLAAAVYANILCQIVLRVILPHM